MKIGTSHFNSFASAVKYYNQYGFDVEDIETKITNKEIFVGKPLLKEGEMLSTDNDGRYQIETI